MIKIVKTIAHRVKLLPTIPSFQRGCYTSFLAQSMSILGLNASNVDALTDEVGKLFQTLT